MMSVDVVTGAFGYSGAAIARDLLAAGRQVRTLTSHPRDDRDIEALPLDFTDVEQLTRSLDGAETLYNTYWVRFSHGQNTQDRAVHNSGVLFKAAKNAGVRRIVHVSITHADASSPYPYFRGKAEVEQQLMSTGLPYTILRPVILFGGDGVLINNIAWLLRRLPVFAIGGSGEYRVRPIHVDDLARLATGAWTGDVTMDAVGPQSLAFKKMVAAIRTAVGSHAVLVPVPGQLVTPLAGMLGALLHDVLLTGEEYRAMAAGLADSTAAATGQTVFTDWVAERGADLGRRYANELDRHYRLPDRPVLYPPDESKAGPVLVDGRDLDVDQPEWQRDLADHVVGDIAVVAGRPARPGGPDCSGGIDPLRQ
jgi:NADH dehydrogenase